MKKVKKQLTLIVLLLANIFLLAHGVLPHSHHDGIVCFSLEELLHQHHYSDIHKNTSDCCCSHEEADKTHHHDASHEDCDLKDVIVRQNNDTHEDILPCPTCLSLMYVIYLPNQFSFTLPQFGQWLEEKPYINNYTSPFTGSVRSLRAPPVSYFLA